jgi:hypothetical protein
MNKGNDCDSFPGCLLQSPKIAGAGVVLLLLGLVVNSVDPHCVFAVANYFQNLL